MKQAAITKTGAMTALIEQGGKYKREIIEIEAWLIDNVKHTDFVDKVHHRNWLTVELDRIRKKMELQTGELTEKDYHDNISVHPNRQMY